MSEKILSIADLKQDVKNARKHNPRNIEMIETSLRQIGVARSGVIDDDGVILAGNGTYEALVNTGIDRVKVVEADGNEWVVVQRKGLTEEQKRILSISDNRAAELATWDAPTLKAQGIDLHPWFSDREVDQLDWGKGGPGSFAGETDQSGELKAKFNILIECRGEHEQVQLLQQLTQEGYNCRSLIS